VIAQEFVNIDSTDNVQTLAKKVLDKEHTSTQKLFTGILRAD